MLYSCEMMDCTQGTEWAGFYLVRSGNRFGGMNDECNTKKRAIT